MAKVLTQEDFKEGETAKEDTSKPEPEVDDKIVIQGRQEPEPEQKEPPSREEPQLKPSEEKKYKYANMEEFDHAYKEAERKMHEATTRAAEYEKKLAQLNPPKVETIEDRITKMTEDTLDRIRTIPSESASRDRDAGVLWAKLQREIARMELEEERKKQHEQDSLSRRLYDRAEREGFKSKTEMKWFGREFGETDPSLSVDDRISRAVESTKEALSDLRAGLVPKSESDRDAKDAMKVLGRGSSRSTKSSDDEKQGKPKTLSDILSETYENRRMKREDLR